MGSIMNEAKNGKKQINSMLKGMNFDNVQLYEKGVKLTPGEYVVEIKRCLFKETQQAGNAFIAEFEILKSTNEERPPGMKASYFCSLVDKAVAASNLLAFLAACNGVSASDKEDWEAIGEEANEILTAAAEEGILEGKKIRIRAELKISEKRKLEYTKYHFTPYEG